MTKKSSEKTSTDGSSLVVPLSEQGHVPERESRLDLEQMAKAIKEGRQRAGLTQEQVAERVGISTAHYKRLESPVSIRSIPSAFTVAKVAKVLKLSLDELLGHVKSEEERLDAIIAECQEHGVFPASMPDFSFEQKKTVLNALAIHYTSDVPVEQWFKRAQQGMDRLVSQLEGSNRVSVLEVTQQTMTPDMPLNTVDRRDTTVSRTLLERLYAALGRRRPKHG